MRQEREQSTRHIQKLTGNQPITTIIGGMHLLSASQERIDKTVEEIQRMKTQRLLPCHCTGMAALARIWHEFPGRCTASPVGTVERVNK